VLLTKAYKKIMAAWRQKSGQAAPVDPLTAGSAQQQYTHALIPHMDYRFITGNRYASEKILIMNMPQTGRLALVTAAIVHNSFKRSSI
jgi:hypothetical protein